MAGLDPAIHDFLRERQDVDARHKAGHDEKKDKRPGAIPAFFRAVIASSQRVARMQSWIASRSLSSSGAHSRYPLARDDGYYTAVIVRLDRTIQYAAASRFYPWRRRLLDARLSRA
jgi:hypothetical protein